jgi:hypothetical protein
VSSRLAKLGSKKSKKAVQKVVATVVQSVPSAFSVDEMIDKPRQTGFFSCLCCELRFRVRHAHTPGSENEFVDVETFLDIVPEARGTPGDSAVPAEAEAGFSQAPSTKDEASPKFAEDLERTVSKSGDLVEDPSLIGNHEEILDDQDPTPSVTAYNKSFGTSFRGELLSVSGGADHGIPKFSLLWKSPKLMGETGGDAPKKKLRLSGKTISVAEKQTSSSLQKPLMISDFAVQVSLGTLNKKKVSMLLSSSCSVDLLDVLTCFVAGSLLVFAGFEENVRKLSSSDLSKFSNIYDLKASIVGKVISERLLEKEELVRKLIDESRKLKRDLNKARASSLDLEQ